MSLAAFLLLSRLAPGPSADQCGAGGLGLHEPGADGKAGGLLGRGPAPGPSGTWAGFPASSTGTWAPPCSTGSRCSQVIGQRLGSSLWLLSDRLGALRRAGAGLGIGGGGLPGPLAGSAHPRLLPGDLQHPRLLAGAAAAYGFLRVAGLAAHRAFRAHRRGGRAPSPWLDRLRHAILPALTLSVTGVANIALHTREKLVDVLASDYVLLARARGESRRSIGAAPRPAQRGPARPHPAVCLHQRDHRRLGAGGAGVLLPRAGPGRRHRWPGQRLAPAAGHHGYHRRLGVWGQPGRGSALRRWWTPASARGWAKR